MRPVISTVRVDLVAKADEIMKQEMSADMVLEHTGFYSKQLIEARCGVSIDNTVVIL